MTRPDSELISVVIPAFNRSSLITGAIKSVLRQTWTNLELIIVDDCSTDDTVAVIRAIDDPRIRVIEMAENSGPSAARNRGIEHAKGTWVAFQDSDDEWLPDKLALQMSRIAELGPTCVGAYCGMAVEGSIRLKQGQRVTVRYLPDPDLAQTEGDLSNTLNTTSAISTQMLMVRRSILERLDGFDESLQALEDWDLAIRLAEQGPIAFVDRILVIQRFSPNSITRNRRKWVAARARLLEKHQSRLQSNPVILAQQYRNLAGEYRLEGMASEAVAAMEKARRTTPGSPGVWIRSLYLHLWKLFRR